MRLFFSNPLGIFILFALICFSTLMLRTQYLIHTQVNSPIRADAAQYTIYAYNLNTHGVFSKTLADSPVPDAYRSPGYPILLSQIITWAPDAFYPTTLYVQAILSALTAGLTFLAGLFFLPLGWALAGGILVAISPHLMSLTGYVLTETLTAFWMILGFYLWFTALERGSKKFWMGAGLAWGMAVLTNETLLFFPFFAVGIWTFFQFKNSSKSHRPAMAGILIFILCLSLFPLGWQIRNQMNLPPEAERGSHRARATLIHGSYPEFILDDPARKYYPHYGDPEYPAMVESAPHMLQVLTDRIMDRPWRYLSWYLFEKPYYVWSWDILQGQGDVYIYPVNTSWYQTVTWANVTRLFMKLTHPLILIITALGFVLAISYGSGNNPPFHLWMFGICIYVTLVYTVFAPWPRYTIPLRPELYLCFLWSLHQGRTIFARKG